MKILHLPKSPFLTGANLAIIRHYLKRLIGKKQKIKIIGDEVETDFNSYSNILITNGDLGKHFPVAKGIPLGSGDFQVVLSQEKGIFKTYKQLVHAWKGDLSEQKEKVHVEIFRTKNLKIIPDNNNPFFLNVDGQCKTAQGSVEFSLYGKVELITG